MQITFDGKDYNVKFNFNALFKANTLFSNTDKDGNSMKDGAANLFIRLISGDDTALSDVVELFIPKKASRDQINNVVDELTNDGEEAESVVNEFIDEMKKSGFFGRAIKNYKKQIERGIVMLKKKDKSDETTSQMEALKLQQKLLDENV